MDGGWPLYHWVKACERTLEAPFGDQTISPVLGRNIQSLQRSDAMHSTASRRPFTHIICRLFVRAPPGGALGDAIVLRSAPQVDFEEDMMRSAFAVINNPVSESACGCGSSFAIKNFEKNPALD